MRVIAIIGISLWLVGCTAIKGVFAPKPEAVEVLPEEELYHQAKEKLDQGSYTRAIELYQQLESRYPFGRYGPQVLLDLAYAQYKQGDAESGLVTLERFFKLYPTHERLDYAYYLRGLIHTSQGMGFIKRYFPIDLTSRDVSPLAEAYQDFVTLSEKFPDSQYRQDAEQRRLALFDWMARHELHVAEFYLQREAYLAAANRAARIVRDYPKTSAVPRALKIMERAYRRLGMNELAELAAKTYALNFGEQEPPPLKPRPNTLLGWVFWVFRWD
jgi:outer membrane protein assembly factor BamD